MDVKTMRRVDHWVGAPLCALLTVFRRVSDLLRGRRLQERPRRIAVIKLAEQGATVLAYPALLRAREMVGAENVFFVVFSPNRFILDLLQVVPPENVIAIRTGGVFRTLLNTLKAVLRMRREGIDAAVDYEFFARSSAILTYLSGARIRVGLHGFFGEASYRGDLMTHRMSPNPFLHAAELFDIMMQALELSPNEFPACDLLPPKQTPLPRHEPEPGVIDAVNNILREALGHADPAAFVLLNANCGDLLPLRRWPTERYIDLARRLLDRYPEMAIVLTGAPDEAIAAQELVDRIGSDRCVSVAGRTTLPQLFALYGLAELMVTNDSGPAHYATLTPIDVITLFGPETPAVFGARTPRSHLLWAGIACSPCVNAFNDRRSACRDNRCMQRLDVDQVFALACDVYDRRRAERRHA